MSGRDIGIVALVVIGILILVPVLGGMGMMGGGRMMGPGMMSGPWAGGRWGGGWGAGMHFIGGLFWLLILVGIVLLITSAMRHQGAAPSGSAEAPLDILKRRLAKGEITREEYDALKKELS
jgi:putative membrane protein